jgi:hypothetical protein
MMIGIFRVHFKHEIPYIDNITQFKDNIRFIEIIISRDGGAGTICPLYFDGAVNYFAELPLPNNNDATKNKYMNFYKNSKKKIVKNERL